MLKSIKNKLFGKYPDLNKIYYAIMLKTLIFSDWCHMYIFKTKKKVTTPFGFTLVSRNYIGNRTMLDGTFETAGADIIKSHLHKAEVFVDVGANIGYYTCLARSLSKYVLAFEPQPQNLECLYASLSSNGWSDTEVFPLGLSHTPGLLTLYGASGPSASLVKGWSGYSERFRRIISVNTMDNVLGDRFDGKKLFIKIDVEGAEYDVLRGATKIITMSPRPTWFIEICLSEFHPGGLNPNYEATFKLFWQHGYEVRMANTENKIVTAADIRNWLIDNKTKIGGFNHNYLFIPNL
jgi:FkbM family methyltransferase